MVANFQRARQPEQKESRRRAIFLAAGELLEEGGIDAVGLSAIARRAGLAKSNIYRYFESREQILLHLLLHDEARWVKQLERELTALGSVDDAPAVAGVVATSLGKHERLCVLTTVLASVLERNVSEDTVREFKQEALALGIRISNALGAALPSLDRDSLTSLQHLFHALIAGLWPLSHPPAAVRAVVSAPEFAFFRHDFERDLKRGVELLLWGAGVPRPVPVPNDS